MSHLSEEELIALALVCGSPKDMQLSKFRAHLSTLFPKLQRSDVSTYVSVQVTIECFVAYRDWYEDEALRRAATVRPRR